jgi:hypothetical protein
MMLILSSGEKGPYGGRMLSVPALGSNYDHFFMTKGGKMCQICDYSPFSCWGKY